MTIEDLVTTLFEENPVPEGEKRIALFDIDMTLLRAGNIYIHKIFDGKDIPLTPKQYAEENVKEELAKGIKYDMREFRDPVLVKQSIESGNPIIKNLKIVNDHKKKGWHVGILTARGLEDVIHEAINKWVMFQKDKGIMDRVGKVFVKNLVHAINDEAKVYPGTSDFEKKANVIKKYASKFDKVKFIDDDDKNIRAVRALNLSNVIAVKAWKPEEE